MSSNDDAVLLEKLRSFIGEKATPQVARDPVNHSTIRNWCDAMGERNPIYTDADLATQSSYEGIVAPMAMLDVWTMPGNIPRPYDPADPRAKVFALLEEAGYKSVVGTNTREDYLRPLRLDELLTATLSLKDVSERKTTGMGTGYFVTTITEFTNQDGERVGTWEFCTFKFKPRELSDEELAKKKKRKEQMAKIPKYMRVRPRPGIMKETEFFWDGVKAHELRIQHCQGCQRLAHPPVVRCPECGSYELGYQVASGRATLYSFVEPVYPPMPFMRYPYVVGLVELEEGTRLVTNIVNCAPEQVEIGMPLELTFVETDPEMTLPMFRPTIPPRNSDHTLTLDEVELDQQLALHPIDVTSQLVIGGAIASRDFENIHHEKAAAQHAGLKDVFMNVLTTTGICARYINDWAGPGALVRAIDIRLGVPNVAGDVMTLSASVAAKEVVDGRGLVTLSIRATNGIGDHVTGTVTVELPIGGCK
jgi:uncharacterized OB-fold protein/acyl dehydratase